MAKKILVVEDDNSLLNVLRDKLAKEGFEVIRTQNGEEGLAAAFSGHPDLILLDILMPKMDGIAMLKQLRQDEWGKTVPVILLTNVGDVKHISDAVNNNVTDYLVKSDWDLVAVVKKIKDKLS